MLPGWCDPPGITWYHYAKYYTLLKMPLGADPRPMPCNEGARAMGPSPGVTGGCWLGGGEFSTADTQLSFLLSVVF